MRFAVLVAVPVLLFGLTAAQATEDVRALVKLPEPMRTHMLANMRDHLTALNEIQTALAKGEFGKAADVAENRLGMSSLASHNAAHMAPYMPKAMQDTGTEMHRAASRFARAAQEAAVDGKLSRPLAELSQVTQQCVACHASYRLH
jgi:cytochrome c556